MIKTKEETKKEVVKEVEEVKEESKQPETFSTPTHLQKPVVVKEQKVIVDMAYQD